MYIIYIHIYYHIMLIYIKYKYIHIYNMYVEQRLVNI